MARNLSLSKPRACYIGCARYRKSYRACTLGELRSDGRKSDAAEQMAKCDSIPLPPNLQETKGRS